MGLRSWGWFIYKVNNTIWEIGNYVLQFPKQRGQTDIYIIGLACISDRFGGLDFSTFVYHQHMHNMKGWKATTTAFISSFSLVTYIWYITVSRKRKGQRTKSCVIFRTKFSSFGIGGRNLFLSFLSPLAF